MTCSTKDTAAIKQAIASCAGGGEIFFPAPGLYLTGPFNMTDNQALHIPPAARVLASPDLADYPIVASFPSYGKSRDIGWLNSTCRYGAVVGAVGAYNVSIFGGGTVDGQGSLYFWPEFDKREKGLLACSRPHLVEFEHCKGISLDHMTFINSPFWTVHFIYSDSIRATNITVLAPADRGNTDGLNPDSSTNVFIKDCYIDNGDDGIAIKSGMNEAGIEVGMPTANVFIENVTTKGRGGIAMGSEMSGGVENITIKDVKLLGQRTIHMKTTKGRGGYFRNLTFINVKESIQLWSSYSGGNESGPYPHISDFHFTNCPSCSLGCGKIPSPAFCNESSFTYDNSCGHKPPTPPPPVMAK